MVQIRKKTGLVQSFDPNKIIQAIKKSAERVNVEMTPTKNNKVVELVLDKIKDLEVIDVKDLHNLVEISLDDVDQRVANSYREYRNYKLQFVKMMDDVYRKKLELNNIQDASNANADSQLVTTQKAITYAELNSELYSKFFLTDEERNAVKDGYIYIHDKGSRLDMSNCCLFDMKNVLKGGFEMGNMHYNEPKSLAVAMSVAVDIIFNAGSSQYGGFTVPEVDKLFSPYAEKSYNTYCKEYLQIKNNASEKEVDKYATDKLRRELEQHVQAWEMKLNSCETSRGDYIFTSVSFGLAKDRFGKMITSAFLKVRKEGQGKEGFKRPVLFPKLTFMYDEELHGEGKDLEDLFLEAVDCTMKAQYPDFLSLSGDGYAPSIYKKYKVAISRMGCVKGNHKITYRNITDYVEKNVSFFDFWNDICSTHDVVYKSGDGYSSDYANLDDIEILDLETFVPCKRIIRNPDIHDWCVVELNSGDIIECTSDHRWSTNRGVWKTLHLLPGDEIQAFKDGKVYVDTIRKVSFVGDKEGDAYKWSFDVTTTTSHFNCDHIRSHNCRANLSPWYEIGGMEPSEDMYEVTFEDGSKSRIPKSKYENGEAYKLSNISGVTYIPERPVYNGRHNMGAISLNFPMIVQQAKEENKDFFDLLNHYLDLCRKIHIRTRDYFSHKKAGINPMAYCQGGFYGGNKRPDEELGLDFLKPCTFSFGITALNEATVAYNGKTIYEDKSEFAEKILKYINDYANKYKKEDGVLYAVYSTPAESLCSLQVKQFREKYGIIPGVSDKEYFSNSFHMHVSEDITPVEKQDAEYKCFHLSNGGNIMYNRFTSEYNKDAYVTLIRRAMRLGYYYGCNQSKDYCMKCGKEFIDLDTCPDCGSEDIVRISRVCGYLGLEKIGNKTRMNQGKLAEIADRKSM